MSRRRFSDVKRGGELNRALTAYTTRLTNPPQRNVGGGTPRAPQETVAINPYGFGTVDTDTVLAARPQSPALPAGLLVAANSAVALTDLGAAVKLRGFKPARVTIQQGARSVEPATSDFTTLRYLKYVGLTRFTSPFGRAVATDLELEARNLIRADFLDGNANQIRRISFAAEQRSEYA